MVYVLMQATTPNGNRRKEIDEEVLVSDGKNVWTDTWVECGEGVCFENTEGDELYWMSLPEPPKEVE